MASVSGPMEVRLREELPDRATFEIVHRPLEGVGGKLGSSRSRKSQAHNGVATPSRAIVNTLEAVFPPLLNLGHHPRSLIQLVVQSMSPSPPSHAPQSGSLEDIEPYTTWPRPAATDADRQSEMDQDGGVSSTYAGSRTGSMTGSYFTSRAACINASTLALLHAGSIGMKGLIVAVALAYVSDGPGSEGGVMLVDPSNEEERSAISRHGFAWAFGADVSPFASTMDGGNEVKMELEGEARDGRDVELVWAENEGDFSRQEVSRSCLSGVVGEEG